MSWQSFDVRIVLVGSARAGKTALLTKWATGAFPRFGPAGAYLPTTGSSFAARRLSLGGASESTPVGVGVWDLSGAPQFHLLSRAFVRGADVAIGCWDATDRESFERMKVWVREAREVESECRLYLFCTKMDLVAEEPRGAGQGDAQQPEPETLQLERKAPSPQAAMPEPASPQPPERHAAQPGPVTPRVEEERPASAGREEEGGHDSDGSGIGTGTGGTASGRGGGSSEDGGERGGEEGSGLASPDGSSSYAPDSFWGSPPSPGWQTPPARGDAAPRPHHSAPAPQKVAVAVSREEEEAFGAQIGARVFHVSARSGRGLREAFEAIVAECGPGLLQRRRAEAAASFSPFARSVSITSRLAAAEGGFAPVTGPGGRAYSTGEGSLAPAAGGLTSRGASRGASRGLRLGSSADYTFDSAVFEEGRAHGGEMASRPEERRGGRSAGGSAAEWESPESYLGPGGRLPAQQRPPGKEGCRMT